MSSWKIYQERNPANAKKSAPPGKFGPMAGVVVLEPGDVPVYLDHLKEATGICHSAERIDV